jgi:hypothetical protein
MTGKDRIRMLQRMARTDRIIRLPSGIEKERKSGEDLKLQSKTKTKEIKERP